MAVSKTNAQTATATVVRNGRTAIKCVQAKQRAPAAPVLFLQIFNTNAPTVGTTAPFSVIAIPAGNANLDISYVKEDYQANFGGKDLSTGFSYAVTTTYNGLTAPTAGQEPEVEIHYEALG